MIAYEELAAALEGHTSGVPASTPSLGAAPQYAPPVEEPLAHEMLGHEAGHLEDPTFNGEAHEANPELELGDVLSDEDAS